MKLEMDLLRDLLLYVEEKADRPYCDLEDIKIAGWTDEQITYHVIMAAEDGLLKATVDGIPDMEDPAILHMEYSVHRLTMRGHNFLGSIAEPSNWDAIKGGAKKMGVVTVDAAVDFAKAYVKAKISEYTGVPV